MHIIESKSIEKAQMLPNHSPIQQSGSLKFPQERLVSQACHHILLEKCKTDLKVETDEKGTNIYRSLLRARLFTGVISPNPHNNPVRKVL